MPSPAWLAAVILIVCWYVQEVRGCRCWARSLNLPDLADSFKAAFGAFVWATLINLPIFLEFGKSNYDGFSGSERCNSGFTGIFILAATLCFWTIQGLEVANIFTDGGREMAQYPLIIYQKWVTVFFFRNPIWLRQLFFRCCSSLTELTETMSSIC